VCALLSESSLAPRLRVLVDSSHELRVEARLRLLIVVVGKLRVVLKAGGGVCDCAQVQARDHLRGILRRVGHKDVWLYHRRALVSIEVPLEQVLGTLLRVFTAAIARLLRRHVRVGRRAAIATVSAARP